ncbi:PadR family transcriptional regulator [Listeria sp. FSL L7-1582]|uniref:PadR family transcriptional regulator n=1 Tax=Listeria weihenstephanensis TaxID=1006155 RepID=A0A1S7FXS4_9LIST|nr:MULTISPECIES: PadR family transcriptional regulator [Listeria]AQY52155.1 PadR family transcriptional regulator [Listeria weihenstephanensis]EUJ39441.1 PadR family transcriptional regulator [Listeria weihenstephanensis FSL R9-0317]MBC6308549.1 PadR family transcriptional regulator [Listeria portnoyi]
MSVTTQFRKGALDMCVLYILQTDDFYGYDLTQQIKKHIPITESTLYPLLRRLVKDGYCATYTVESPTGPQRKYYHITHQGRIFLKETLQEWDEFTASIAALRKEIKPNE